MVACNITPPACELCGARSVRPLWSLRFEAYPGPFRLWRCARCGVAFHWPRLSAQAICDQYDSDYYIFNLPLARRWSRAAQLYLEHLLPLENRTGRRLLEVGCAQGDLLAIAQARGWEVHGIEISSGPARRAIADHAIPVEIGTLEDHAPRLGRFDVAIATDVIEHVLSPRDFLAALRSVLRPGGLAVLETPNLDGLWSRVGGRRWIGYNRFHLFLFGSGTLTRLLKSCGFSACRASSNTHCAHVRWGERPELAGLIDQLPPGLQWRAKRELNRLAPAHGWSELRRRPPHSLAEAIERVESLSTHALRRRCRRLCGDNLAVVARA